MCTELVYYLTTCFVCSVSPLICPLMSSLASMRRNWQHHHSPDTFQVSDLGLTLPVLDVQPALWETVSFHLLLQCNMGNLLTQLHSLVYPPAGER